RLRGKTSVEWCTCKGAPLICLIRSVNNYIFPGRSTFSTSEHAAHHHHHETAGLTEGKALVPPHFPAANTGSAPPGGDSREIEILPDTLQRHDSGDGRSRSNPRHTDAPTFIPGKKSAGSKRRGPHEFAGRAFRALASIQRYLHSRSLCGCLGRVPVLARCHGRRQTR